jgi:hypothetical protein
MGIEHGQIYHGKESVTKSLSTTKIDNQESEIIYPPGFENLNLHERLVQMKQQLPELYPSESFERVEQFIDYTTQYPKRHKPWKEMFFDRYPV